MIKVQRPEAVYYLPQGLPQKNIKRFEQEGSEPWLRNRMIELLNHRPGSVISAGTYVGGLLPYLSKHASVVYAWEPVKEHYKCTKKMLRTNSIANVLLHHAALGNAHTPIDITTGCEGSDWLGGASSVVIDDVVVSPLLSQGNWQWRTQTVTQNCIDDFEYDNLSILQLDLEGYELTALQGAVHTIKQHTPWIIVENPSTELNSWLETHSYSFQEHYAGDSVYKYTKGADHVNKTTK